MGKLKKCKGCERFIPISEFPLTSSGNNRDYIFPMNYCRECKNARQRDSYQRHREKRCADRRANYNRQRKTGQSQASLIVSKCVELGYIVRPNICECCGKESENIHGHHDDYNEPLEVQWLCSKCHREEHLANDGFAIHKKQTQEKWQA